MMINNALNHNSSLDFPLYFFNSHVVFETVRCSDDWDKDDWDDDSDDWDNDSDDWNRKDSWESDHKDSDKNDDDLSPSIKAAFLGFFS